MGKILIPMPTGLMAADPPVFHNLIPGTVKGILQGDRPFLQPRRRGDDLKGRTGLIGVIDAAVAPHLIQKFLLLGLCPALSLRFFLCFFCFLRQGEGIIQIKFWGVGHPQDFPVLRIHNDNRDAVRPFLLQKPSGLLLDIGLYIVIQADLQIVSGHRLQPALPRFRQFYSSGVRQGQDFSRRALQDLIILHLQTDNALVVASGKPQHLGCQTSKRIIPFIVLVHLHPGQSVLPDPVPRLLVHVGGNALHGADLLHLLPDRIPGQSQL